MFVIIFCKHVHAQLAEGTMEEIFAATCLARATFVTVKYLLARVVVEQVAKLAKVFAECDLALTT